MTARVIDGVKLVDYGGFVDLVAEHTNVPVLAVTLTFLTIPQWRHTWASNSTARPTKPTKKATWSTWPNGTRTSPSTSPRQENVDMTDSHWEVVNFLREYYNEYQIAPAVRVLTKAIGKKLGAGEGQQQVPVRAVPLRPGQAGVQDRRPAQADRLHLSACSGDAVAPSHGSAPDGEPARHAHVVADRSSIAAAVLRRHRAAGGRRWRYKIRRLRAHAGAAEDPDHAGADHDSAASALRMAREVVLFESLFKSNKWTWMFGWLFHVALLLVLLRHLRYFTEPVWLPVRLDPAVRHVRRLRHGGRPGRPVGAALPGRPRALHLDAVRPPDAGAAAGDRPDRPGDDASSRTPTSSRSRPSCSGLMRFDLQPLPADPVLLVHLALVALLMVDVPDQQAAACAGPVLQPDAQPGRRPARSAPRGRLGRRARRRSRR